MDSPNAYHFVRLSACFSVCLLGRSRCYITNKCVCVSFCLFVCLIVCIFGPTCYITYKYFCELLFRIVCTGLHVTLQTNMTGYDSVCLSVSLSVCTGLDVTLRTNLYANYYVTLVYRVILRLYINILNDSRLRVCPPVCSFRKLFPNYATLRNKTCTYAYELPYV